MNRKILIVLFFTLVLAANGWTQERQLKRYTTYQTSLTDEDIMRSFVNEVRTYLQRYDNYGCYYWIRSEVYQEKDKQNYAWRTTTHENIYQWGTVYSITLWISNAGLQIKFCNGSFTAGGEPAREIITTRSDTVGGNMIRRHIMDTALSMFNESEMVLKMYNSNYPDKSKTAFAAEILGILF